MNKIITINGIECYEENGTAYLKLESVARGLGFTRIAESGNEVVRWETVRRYLSDLKVINSKIQSCQQVGTDGLPEFIPENVFYRLAMKAKNETAEKFQALVADEIIPSLRKTGGYIVGQDSLSEDALIEKALQVVARRMEERERQMKRLEAEKAQIEAKVVELQPKADYFDDLVDRELLTNFRDTAKEFGLKQKQFIQMLESHGYLYRTPTVKDKNGKKNKGQLKPVQRYVDDGLFEIKDIKGAYSHYAGNQTLITPKGKSVFQKLIPIWMKGE